MKSILQGIFYSGAGLFRMTVMLLIIVLLPVGSYAVSPDQGQRTFASPEEARQALIGAAQTKDQNAMKAIFGPVLHELEPGDPVEQAAEFDHFVRHVLEGTEIVKQGDDKATLVIGTKKWPFPVPIIKKGSSWHFDTEAGREEILNRRIGRNELHAINVCRAYVDAQREYYAMPEPDGDQLPKYAQHMISSPGRKNGLYWPTVAGVKESPLGLLVAKAKEGGYMQKRNAGEHGPRPFHGYYFQILTRQGPNAPGGKFSYIINGNMVAGYALVAYPARWGVSGIMTFIVNQRGRVYQKNLGPKTAVIARKMKAYNPDLSWKLVEEQ
ncbi:MAG: DUF2950 domain-containing protein [Desulfuromonadaceae bacterium]|nr:DUF2950 domain-containing protein [Desulfuromonadaceae bacterium]